MEHKPTKRDRTRQEKFNDEEDFIVGLAIGAVASFCCGFIFLGGKLSNGMLWLAFLLAALFIGGVLLLGFYLARKRGQRFVLHGMLISLLFGLFLVGLCAAG